jgi:hypothetical protein
MTSSGTYAFSPSNGELVLAAFERVQIRAPGLRQEHMQSARRELNFLFAAWSNFTPNLWEVVRTQTVLTPGQATYSIPPQTVMILDASIVLNYGTAQESRRYITPVSRTEYLSYANQQSQGAPTVIGLIGCCRPASPFTWFRTPAVPTRSTISPSRRCRMPICRAAKRPASHIGGWMHWLPAWLSD